MILAAFWRLVKRAHKELKISGGPWFVVEQGRGTKVQ